MFKRHPKSSLCILAWYTWLALACFADLRERKAEWGTIYLLIFCSLAFIYNAITSKGQDRKDALKFLGLVYLPFALAIIAFIIFLLCGGSIINKLF